MAFEIDWNLINWIGQTYGIWLHDYWPFYLVMAIGGVFVIDTWWKLRRVVKKLEM